MLVWSAVLCVVIPYPAVTVLLQLPGGFTWGVGNRDTPFTVPAWIERTRRAHANMVENLIPFACLVLAAHLGGKTNATTALAAQLFFWSRVAYTLVYVAGIPLLRTLVFAVGITADFLLLVQILG